MSSFLSHAAPDVPLLVLMAAVFLLAGLVKGVIGLGLPTAAMALLGLLMAPADAAALLVVPSLVTNIWQMRPWPALPPLWRRLAPMQLGVCVGTGLGAWAFGAPAGAAAAGVLGVALVLYAGWSLVGARLAVLPRHERVLGPAVGALTGVTTAATGVFVIPAVPYLQALGLERDALVQAMGLSFTVSTVALALGLALNGHYSAGMAGWSALLLVPALAGMQLGQWVRERMSPALFRRCFLIGLLLLGLHQAGRALWA